MEILFLFGLIFLALVAGFIFLAYWVPAKFGYARTGKNLAKSLGLIFVAVVLYFVFEDQLFSRADAAKLLQEQNIQLSGVFELVDNKTMSAPGDYYHVFHLRITANDKQTIINQIKSSTGFKGRTEEKQDLLRSTEDWHVGKRITQNYEDEVEFVREYFQPNGEGNAPTYRKIKIDKKENLLTFEDIDE